MDKNAAYPKAVDDLKADHILSESFELQPVKYLNNIVEHGIERNGSFVFEYFFYREKKYITACAKFGQISAMN